MIDVVKLDPQWAGRRRAIWTCLLFAFATIFYSISEGPATAQAVAGPAFIFAGIVVTAYIGGASFEASKGVPAGNVVTTTTITPPVTRSTTTTTTPTMGAPAP